MPKPSAPSTEYSADDIVPPSAWGKDHWSMLAYMETVMVEVACFQVGADPRMRQGPRSFRIMHEQCPQPSRPTKAPNGMVMRPEHGSRLADGSYIPGHDDWHCVQDMAAVGFFTAATDAVEPGVALHLSEIGATASNELRAHRRGGGGFAGFKPSPALAAAMSAYAEPVRPQSAKPRRQPA